MIGVVPTSARLRDAVRFALVTWAVAIAVSLVDGAVQGNSLRTNLVFGIERGAVIALIALAVIAVRDSRRRGRT